MKTIILLIIVLAAGICSKAQNMFIAKIKLNAAVSGNYVRLDYRPGPGWTGTITSVSNTNANGELVITVPAIDELATFDVSTINCQGDTIFLHDYFDTSRYNDTIYFNFNYCDTACAGLDGEINFADSLKNVSFTQTSTGNKFTWDFGDGTTSTLANPNKTYSSYGTYLVTLTIEDTVKHCIKIIYKYVYLAPPYSRTIVVKGRFTDRAVNNYPVELSFYNHYTKKLTNKTTYTNLAGEYLTTFDITLPAGNIAASIFTCDGPTVPSVNYGMADTTSDTIIINMVYCPPCNNVNANFYYYSVSGKNMAFTQSSSGSTNQYSWNFGDGYTSGQANPNHKFFSFGTYTVCLIARDTLHGCADTTCKTITITSIISEIDGHVIADSGDYLDSLTAQVYLIQIDSISGDTLLTSIDSTLIYGGGYFKFTGVQHDNYYLKAALLPSSAHYANYLPTYHMQSAMWSGATAFNSGGSTSNLNKDIHLIAGSNPGGSGFIGGYVSAGANKTGDPLQKIQLLLLDASNKPINYCYTDAGGQYKFNNLAFGTYKVIVEIWGKPCQQYTVTVDATHPSATNGNFSVNTKNITLITTSTGINTVTENTLKVYPNPAQNVLNIAFDGETGTEINIYSMVGELVMETKTTATQLDIGTLPNGMYIIKARSGDTYYTARFAVSR